MLIIQSLIMADKDNEISTPSNFGAFIPIEDASDSESVDEEEEVGKYESNKFI